MKRLVELRQKEKFQANLAKRGITKYKPFIPRLKIERIKDEDKIDEMVTAIKRHLGIKGNIVVFDTNIKIIQ